MEYTIVMKRFNPKMVIKTKYGIFDLAYGRLEDNAYIYYAKNIYDTMELIPVYGNFPGTLHLSKYRLEELRKEENGSRKG